MLREIRPGDKHVASQTGVFRANAIVSEDRASKGLDEQFESDK